MTSSGDYRSTPLWAKCLRKEQKNLSPWGFLGIPNQFHSTNIDDFTNDEKILKRARKLLNNSPMIWSDGYNLVLHGKEGVGKSLVAAEWVKEVARYHDHQAYFISFERLLGLLERIKTQRYAADQEDQDLLRSLRVVELLVIDGFGEVEVQNMIKGSLSALIRARTDRDDMSTVLTTQLTAEEMTNSVGDRLAEEVQNRFASMEVTGKSHRRKLKADKIKELDEDD